MDCRLRNQTLILALATLCAPWSTAAGTGGAGTGTDGYPESRFGQPPSHSAFGLDAVKPGDEADAWDSVPRAERRTPDRAPAGLVFSKDKTPSAASNERDASNGSPTEDPERRPGPPEPRDRIEDSAEMGNLAARHKGVQEVALIAGDLGFFPKTVFVSRDVPVRLFVTGASKNTLCIMMDSFQVRKQVRSQRIEEITFTPNEPGRYRFYCPVNGMEGTLVVKEFSSGS